MPAAQLADSSLSRTLAFQFDRLSLSWKFDADAGGSKYPGYSVLADELIDRLTEFVAVVDSASDDSVTIDGCQCCYSNSLDGIGGQNWLTQFLDGKASTVGVLDNVMHFGFRVSREDELAGIRCAVTVQLDEGKEQPPEVDISVVAVPPKPGMATG